MLNQTLFLGFLAGTAVIMITPGPSVALVTSHAIRYGPRIAALTLIGDALGTVVHIVIATIGLQFLVSAADFALPWLQLIGGLYLLHLSWQSYQDSRVKREVRPTSGRNVSALLSGFIACVSNPKAIIFFMAFFPAFIDPEFNVIFQSATYGVIFIFLDGLSIVLYATGTACFFQLRLFKNMNADLLGVIAMGAIGLLLCLKGGFEVLIQG